MRSTRLLTNRARVDGLRLRFTIPVALLAALVARPADARPRHWSTVPAPVVEDAGFEPLRVNDRGLSGGHLWIRLAPTDPLLPSVYMLEPVGGRAPRNLDGWWGRPLPAEADQLVVPIRLPAAALELSPGRSQMFGFQVRGLDGEGRAGAPSEPIWLSFDPARPAHAIAGGAPRSDHVLFFLLAVGLGMLWYWYRREQSPEGKIRLAALTALASVVFLSVTAAMPWLILHAGGVGRASIECLLGQETACAYAAADSTLATATGDPQLLARVTFEVQRWQCASAALRMGQVTALALLLPALVWLLVDPRHRAAQAAAVVGASVAGFTLMVILLYRESIPSWLGADPTRAADLALMATSNVVVAAVLIVRQSLSFLQRAPVPVAVACYGRRRRG